MNRFLIIVFLYALSVLPSFGQNTATTTGLWSACTTWGNPSFIYKNATDTKTINNSITVTLDQNWSTAAVVLNTSGAVTLNSGFFIDFTTSQGADVTCTQTFIGGYSFNVAHTGPGVTSTNGAVVQIPFDYASEDGSLNVPSGSTLSGGSFVAPKAGNYLFALGAMSTGGTSNAVITAKGQNIWSSESTSPDPGGRIPRILTLALGEVVPIYVVSCSTCDNPPTVATVSDLHLTVTLQ